MIKITATATLALNLAFAISPVLSDPFSGFRVDQLPIPQIDPPIQPEGYAFAIWGVFYLWLIASAAFGLWKRAEAPDWHRARLPLILSLAVGVPWIAIAHASAIWATVTIIIMAIGAILALIRSPNRDRWLFQAPVALYAGWLIAASWVTIGTTFAGYGVLMSALAWAITGIIGALIVALVVLRLRPNAPEYYVSIIWALVGIIVANGTALIAVSGVAVLGIVTLLSAAFKMRRPFASDP